MRVQPIVRLLHHPDNLPGGHRLSKVDIMKNRTRLTLIAACVVILTGTALAHAQVAEPKKEDADAIKAMVKESIGWYRIFIDTRAAEAMTPQAVLQWRNPTRGNQEAEGTFVLWLNNGWPEASASIYPWEGELVHEFVSLSREASFVARDEGRVIWAPRTPGVVYKEIPNAPAPAATEAGRLKQMKALSERFKVTMTGWRADKSDREELRLLPKPTYRVAPTEGQGQDTGRIDGCVFTFVQGTDPEAILLMELVLRNGRSRWQYAFARATSGGLEARLDKTVVWDVDIIVGQKTVLDPQMTLRHPLGATAAKR
jgi:hypothetical protein